MFQDNLSVTHSHMQVIYSFKYKMVGNVKKSEENKYLYNLKDIESPWR